jgi:hypothetical protein
MSNEVHVVPETTTADRQHILTDDCWCGTTSQPVKRDDGSMGWVVVHRRALAFVPVMEFMRTPDGTVEYIHPVGEVLFGEGAGE